MSTPPPQPRRSAGAGDSKKNTPPPSSIVTRNGARKAKIQTRAMSAGAKPSASVLAAKKKALHKKKQTVDTVLRDHYQIAMESKNKVKGPTGFVTEPRMAEHRCLWDANYPECPERLVSVIDRCRELNLISQCQEFSPRAASKEELSSLHCPSVYEMLETTHNNHDAEYLERLSAKFDAIYIHPSTHELALIAAGSTIDMVDRIVSGEVQNGAAFVRPPGHHAMRAEPCGYCFYNNVALAAKHAINKHGLKRILIVDWDVHHGQATQQMFYDDPRVVYFSVHRYEHGSFWPSLRQAECSFAGAGRGVGHNFNVPLNKTGMTDADYLAVWHQLLLPMAFEYQPELILISAGYDAAIGCPEGEMEITPACYATLLHLLSCVCVSVCVVLEGGYCLASLAEGAALTLRTLLGHSPPVLQTIAEPSDEIRESILNCIYVHKPYWKCYNYQQTYSVDNSVPNVCDGKKEKHVVTLRWEGDETRPETFATRDCYPLQDDQTKKEIARRLNHLRIVTELRSPLHSVGYIYDEAMLKHKNICEPDHVECPERIMRIHERHRDFGLLSRLHILESARASEEQILAVHSPKHLKRLKELATTKLRDLNNQREDYDSIYFHPDSLESAAVAAGCVIQMVDAVLNNVVGSGVCVVRPPGHHADADAPSGFCLLNSAAAAAAHALHAHGLTRVLILDWDVHHGNGTQKITYEDDKILYMSIHRYDHGSFFPHSTDADYAEVGEGRGEGFNVNVPWNKRGMGDTEYLAAFTQVVLPIAYEYNPELVIVSAGFDACVGDPLGGCKVTPECYGRMTQLLRGLSGGRVVLCLEGGYNVTSISYAMAMCTKALLGDPVYHHYETKPAPHWTAVESINNVIATHKKYWKNLKFQLALPLENVLEEPLPSRGLIVEDEKTNLSTDVSLSITIESKNGSHLDGSLERNMANLSIDKPICSDVVHCGTDDEGNKSICSDGIHCGTDDENENLNSGDKSIEKKISAKSIDKPCSDGIHCGLGEDKKDKSGPSNSKQGTSINKTENTIEKSGPSKVKTELNESKTGPSEVKSGSSESKSGPSEVKTTTESESTEKATLVDYLAENMQAIVNGEMFAVIPLPWCPHLESMYVIPETVKFEQGVRCVECNETVENWVCLHCYITACGRSINGHMQSHYRNTQHPLVLSLCDLSVWCNECDAYVDHPLLYDAKNNAHMCKFGEQMPWCYKSDTIHMQ
ncbi:histone deacetylase 6 isoform X1 [Plodia interpunctella]|uniref:histone deacetylase 6 isoform X1 n=1 Tax=Plodia interpunctella TaxID=58824 RepID=UPI00236768C5|nr:histone deacetylase 6 isoform X1 [Plodia interpunctella]